MVCSVVLQLLAPIKRQFGNPLTWADLIVLAGQTANEAVGMPKTTFCRERGCRQQLVCLGRSQSQSGSEAAGMSAHPPGQLADPLADPRATRVPRAHCSRPLGRH
jgi:catalase (peroxidase I)